MIQLFYQVTGRKQLFLKKEITIHSYKDDINDELFDELEEIFVMADMGVETVVEFVDELRDDVRTKNITNATDLQPIIVDKMFDIYLKGEVVNSNLRFNKEGLSVSQPKDRVSTTPNLSKMDTPPLAKYCALEVAKTAGSSMTRSAPADNAIRALVHLSKIEGVPLCKKLPLITMIMYSAPFFFICSI